MNGPHDFQNRMERSLCKHWQPFTECFRRFESVRRRWYSTEAVDIFLFLFISFYRSVFIFRGLVCVFRVVSTDDIQRFFPSLHSIWKRDLSSFNFFDDFSSRFPFSLCCPQTEPKHAAQNKSDRCHFCTYKPKLTLGEKRKSRNDGIFAFSPVSGPVFSTAVPYSTMFRRRISFRRNAAGWLNLNSHNMPSSIIHWSLGATAENSLKNKFIKSGETSQRFRWSKWKMKKMEKIFFGKRCVIGF